MEETEIDTETETDTDDVVDQLVAESRGNGEGNKRGRKKGSKNKPASEVPSEETPSDILSFRNHEELDAARSNTERPLPQAEENVRTLDDLIAKYRIGNDHDFYADVIRVWPKVFPGGTLSEGLYDIYQQPLTQEFIQSEYGGGRYRVVIRGPRPGGEPGTKHYASITFNLAGDPNYKRLPRAVQVQKARESESIVGPVTISGAAPENEKLVSKAFDMIAGNLSEERDERRRLEDQKSNRGDDKIYDRIAEAHEKRADEAARTAREQLQHEREMHEERLKEERERTRGLEERLSAMENRPAPVIDIGDQLTKIAGVFKPNEETSGKVLDQVFSKQKEESQALREAHQREIDAMRTGHQSETQMMREAHTRMLEAERSQSETRVARMEDQFKVEREERRRDRERFDEQVKDRDLQARDRQQSAIDSAKAQADSRFSTMQTSLENRIEFLNGEIDRLRREVEDMRAKDVEVRDPVLQMQKAKEMAELAKGMFGGAVPESGGIGGNHEEPGLGKLFEKLGDNAPGILDALGRAFNSGGGGGQAPQQQFVMTPQGPAQMVQTPQGPMLIPMQQGMQQLPRGGGGGGGMRRGPQSMPDESDLFAEQERRERRQRRQQPKPRTSRAPEPQAQAAAPAQASDLSPDVEKIAIKEMARLIDESVMGGDDVEDFVEKLMKQYPEPILKQVVAYDVVQLFQAIASNPETKNSAALTPAGQRFVKDAFAQLKSALGI